MRIRRRMLVLALGCIAACSAGRSEQGPQEAGDQSRPSAAVASGAPGDSASSTVIQSGTAGIAKYAAGIYELVLVRDEPLFDDSLAVRDYVERVFAWGPVDSARDWPDSLRVLDAYFKSREGRSDAEYAMKQATTAKDSIEVGRDFFARLRCTEWRSAATLTLDPDGRFTIQDEFRTYCRGKSPAFTRRKDPPGEPTALETCESWEAPMPGIVPHLTCRSGRWWYGRIGYRYVGDTLTLNGDCDGRDTYVLRLPERSMGYAVARSSDASHLEDC